MADQLMDTRSPNIPVALATIGGVLVVAGFLLTVIPVDTAVSTKIENKPGVSLAHIRQIAPAPSLRPPKGGFGPGKKARALRRYAEWKALTKVAASRSDAINKACKLTTPLRRAYAWAQFAHETDGFTTMTERGNHCVKYGKGKLRRVLGNRKGESGCLHKGRGFIQITGRGNYHRFGDELSKELIADNPKLAADPDVSVKVSCAYWRYRFGNYFSDKDNLFKVSAKINGLNRRGVPNGMKSRRAYLKRSKGVFFKRGKRAAKPKKKRPTGKKQAVRVQKTSLDAATHPKLWVNQQNGEKI